MPPVLAMFSLVKSSMHDSAEPPQTCYTLGVGNRSYYTLILTFVVTKFFLAVFRFPSVPIRAHVPPFDRISSLYRTC